MVIISIIYITIFGLAELLYRKGVSAEITRKIVHIGSGAAAALLPFFVTFEVAVSVGLIFSIILIWSKRARILNSVHGISSDSVGSLIFAPSLTVVALIFWNIDPLIFQGTALVLGFSDGLAGLIGKSIGKRKYNIFGIKTWEGSIVFFSVTMAIIWMLVEYTTMVNDWKNIVFVIFGALFVTVAEALTGRGWDNLAVSAVAASVLFFIL